VLSDVIGDLVCPVCGRAVALEGAAVSCESRHSFDVARHGYVSMLAGRRSSGGDTASMVAARGRFLSAGHLDPLADAVAGAAALAAGPGLVVDAGAGTGHYLARVLDALPGRAGIALDASAPALRRAARCHPRAGAVACDVWSSLPVRTGAAGLVLNVFAPRNGAEMHRILSPAGGLVVATPTSCHLCELVGTLGLLRVDESKDERVERALGEWFRVAGSTAAEFEMQLSHAAVTDLVSMGPSAHHVSGDVAAAVAMLPEPVVVTASVQVSTYRPRP
jgi:23S rRNA (guanine745-N1)-methyltransferase